MSRRRKKRARTKARSAATRSEDGRVHLLVHRDGAGHAKSLSFSRDVFQTAWQNRLALAAASTTHGLLTQSQEPTTVVALGVKVMNAATQVGEQALTTVSAPPVACRAGCDHCCHQSVGATPIEVLTLAHFLQEQRSFEELERLRQRLDDFEARTRPLSTLERHDPALPCPLLEDGQCTTYDVRPLSCRGVNSLDAELCDAALHDADARTEYLSGRLEIPRYAEPLRAAHAVSAGVQMAASQLHGLTMEPLELAWGLRVALDDLARSTSEFMTGADPFSGARGGVAEAGSHVDEVTGRL